MHGTWAAPITLETSAEDVGNNLNAWSGPIIRALVHWSSLIRSSNTEYCLAKLGPVGSRLRLDNHAASLLDVLLWIKNNIAAMHSKDTRNR